MLDGWRSSVFAALLACACGATATPLPRNQVGPAGGAEAPPPPGEIVVFAMFDDASGLSVGSRVTVAGLDIGRVSAVAIEQHPRCGRCTRIEMTLRGDLELPVSAAVIKRASSTLGEAYLEIDPGPAPATNLEPGRLHHGAEIDQVIESPSPLKSLDG